MGNRIVEMPVRLESIHEAKERRENVRKTRSLRSQLSLSKYYRLDS